MKLKGRSRWPRTRLSLVVGALVAAVASVSWALIPGQAHHVLALRHGETAAGQTRTNSDHREGPPTTGAPQVGSVVPTSEALGGSSPRPEVSGAAGVRPSLPALAQDAHGVDFWALDDASPDRVVDVIGGLTGVSQGAVQAGQVGQGPGVTSFGFSGITAQVVVPSSRRIDSAVAASAWIRLAPSGPAGGTVLRAPRFSLELSSGRLAMSTCRDGQCTTEISGSNLADGDWHQVAVDTSGDVVTMFVDGLEVFAGRVPKPTIRSVPLTIGQGVKGDIDDVALYNRSLIGSNIAEQFGSGACPQAADTAVADASISTSLPALPLHTTGRYVVDARGQRVRLAGVNWYGAEELDQVPAGLQCQSADAIASQIASLGFNVVRLPWATDTWVGIDPQVPPIAVAANPQLRGLGSREVFDQVVDALARHGLMVILDNHVTRPGWCCSGTDGNGMWWGGYDAADPPDWAHMTFAQRTSYFLQGQSRWLSAWSTIAGRYGPRGSDPQPAVVGADLRNEPRTDALLRVGAGWGSVGLPVWENWPAAATLAGNTVLRADPRLLVAVEGINYATDLRGVAGDPVRLSSPAKVIYSAHAYPFYEPALFSSLDTELGDSWGWLLSQGHDYTAPVWVGEFGTCSPGASDCPSSYGNWLSSFTRYLRAGDIDWTYWSINGTSARGEQDASTCSVTLRFPGCHDDYGLSNSDWMGVTSPSVMSTLRQIEAP